MKTLRISPTTPIANPARTGRKNPRRTTQTSSPRNRPRFRDILVPVDFSPGARQALAFAVPLARQFKGGITLLHVVESRLVPEELSFLSMESDRRITAAGRKLDALARKAVPRSLLKKTLVTAGRPFEVITHTAQGLRMDAIVIATHGRVGVKRLLLGSTAERVVRHSPCPVLTVRQPPDAKPAPRRTASLAPRINRILVPVTFSEPTVNLTRYAVALARTMRARLAFLHIILPLPARYRVDYEQYNLEAATKARQQLDRLAASISKPIKTEILLRQDIPPQGITRTARECKRRSARNEIQILRVTCIAAVTNARFAALHGLHVAPSPSRRRPLRFSNRALVTSLHGAGPQKRRLPSAAWRRALRSGCISLGAPLHPPLHLPRSPTADRSLKSVESDEINWPISDWPIEIFAIIDWKLASHSTRCLDNAMKPRSIVWRRRSPQGSAPRLPSPPP